MPKENREKLIKAVKEVILDEPKDPRAMGYLDQLKDAAEVAGDRGLAFRCVGLAALAIALKKNPNQLDEANKILK